MPMIASGGAPAPAAAPAIAVVRPGRAQGGEHAQGQHRDYGRQRAQAEHGCVEQQPRRAFGEPRLAQRGQRRQQRGHRDSAGRAGHRHDQGP
jgi:hypothetical protein